MATLRNEETEAGKDMWRKVDEAANRAPQWVRNHLSTLVAKRPTSPPQSEKTTQADK